MTVYGYISPPITIIDFAPTVYINDNLYYITQEKDNAISKFVQIDSEIPITKNIIEGVRRINDASFYFYLGPSGKIYSGEYNQINIKLLKLLKSNHINDYAKLSIANFLNLRGQREQLLQELQHAALKKKNHFIYSNEQTELIDISIPSNLIKLKSKLKEFEYLMAETEGLVAYSDIFWVNDKFIAIGEYMCILNEFVSRIENSKQILGDYLNSLPFKKKEILRVKNDSIFNLFFENSIENIISPEEKKIMEKNLLEPYYAEEEIVFKKAAKRIVLSKTDKRFIGKLKQLKEYFTFN